MKYELLLNPDNNGYTRLTFQNEKYGAYVEIRNPITPELVIAALRTLSEKLKVKYARP